MRSIKIGTVAVAILLVAAGIGIGIAQAGGTGADRPVLSFDDQELSQAATSPSEEMQPSSPIETGAISATDSDVSWMSEYGHD